MVRPVPLPEGYVLEGRYMLGAVSRTTAGGIVYTAFDKKLRMMVEILEYLPADCELQRNSGETTVRGTAAFQEKLMRLLADGSNRMHSADSNIYDVLTANGTAYLVHVAPQNNTAVPAAGVVVPDHAEADAEQTRIVEGLFHTETASVSAVTPPDKPQTETVPVPASAAKPQEPPTAVPEEGENNGPSVKLLLGVLAAGIILLLFCCIVFLTSLFRMTDLPGDTDSLLGVPYTEIASVTEDDWLVIGRGNNDSYAPGTVIAEESEKNSFRLLINGYTPTYVMPDMVGMTADGAAALLNRTPFTNAAGLVQGQVTIQWQKTADAPHGMVLEQSPAAGIIAKSSLVTLTVAENPASFSPGKSGIMPDLTGQAYAAQISGHPILISDRIVSDKPAGEIISQYPAAGAAYPEDSPCFVVVSLGPAVSHVPDVRFMTLTEAEKALYGCGVSYTVEYALNSHVLTGLITEQVPAPGESIAYGETVTLTISGEGTWDSGPPIRSEQSEVELAVGDTCTMDVSGRSDTVYYSTSPDMVSVSDSGVVTAFAPGSAVVSASAGGQTAVLAIQVIYDKRLPTVVNGTIGEKISLPALGDAPDTGTNWYTDETMVSLSEKGLMTGKKAGSTLVQGEKDGKIFLYLVHLTEAEQEKNYITIAKSIAADKTKMQNALQKAGLSCTVQEEYSDKAAGTVLRIQYTGYSDDKQYFIAEDTSVVLIVSKGKPSVSSVSVATKPKKTSYTVGEKLDTAGLTLKVVYADKSEEIVSKGFTVSYDFSTAGRKTVAVSFGQRKTSFSVEVINNKAVKAEMVSMPAKLQYEPREKLDPSGIKIKVTYGDGSTKTFTTGFTTSYSFDKAGTSRVNVTIEGVSTYFDVTVRDRTVRSIQVDSLPTKTLYHPGDSINTSGMVLKVNYADGTTQTVRSGWSVQCDLNTAGRKPVTVTYGGKTTTFYITVEEESVTAIRVVSQPHKLTYRIGETIDLAGLELSVTRGSKTTAVSWPDENITYSGDLSKAGEGTIRIFYGGISTTVRVSVSEPVVELLTVLILPDKTEYTTEEKLDTTGLILLAEYDNGDTRRITEGYRTFYDFSKAGKAVVAVTYGGAEAQFTVTVKAPGPVLSLSEEKLELDVGGSAFLTIQYTGEHTGMLKYQVDAPQVVQVANDMDGLFLLALKPGTCRITVSDGTDSAVCTITVREEETEEGETEETPEDTTVPDALSAKASMVIAHQTEGTFMPLLVFTGNGEKDVTVPFSVTVQYDPEKLVPVDMAGIQDGVTVTENGTGTITISGTVTVPKDDTVDAAYIMFFGTDTDAFQVAFS